MRFLRLCTFIITMLGSLTNWAQTVTIIGPTTASVNESKNYIVEFRNENNQAIIPPNGTFTWTAYTGQVTTSSASSATVLWASSGMIEYEMQTADNYYYGYLSVTVSDPTPPDPVSANYTFTYNCGNTIATRGNAPPNGANYQWWWQTTANGTSTTLGNGASITLTSATNLYLRARLTASPFSWSTNSQLIGGIQVYATPPSPSTQANHAAIIGPGSVSLSVGTVAGATSYSWYTQSVGGAALGGVSGSSYTLSVSNSTTFYVANKNPGCENTSRLPVTATVYPEPVLASNPGNVISMGLPVTLSAPNFTYDSYSWKLKNSGGTYVQVSTSPTYATTVTGEYKLTVTKGNALAFTSLNSIILSNGVDALNKNLISVNNVLVSNVKTSSSVSSLTVEQNSQSIQYFDGLGRLVQTVSTQGSPSKADMVSPVFYDAIGRESKKYLPVSLGYIQSVPSGWYKPNLIDPNTGGYINQALTSYSNTTDKIADDTRPFSETVFEASPLNRPLQSFGPGQQWKDNNKAVTHGYLVNVDGTAAGQERIIFWEVDANGLPVKSTTTNASLRAGYYLTGQLNVKSTKDEHGNEVREYVDKEGHTILKKVQVFSGTPLTNNDSHWAHTYYVYDVLGNLRVVLPPEAVKAITAN